MEITTNYQRLLIQCLKEEIKAFLSKPKNKKQEVYKSMAQKWIFDDTYHLDNEFSCIRICRTLGKDVNALRLNVLLAEKRGWTLEEFIHYSMYGEPKEKKNDQDKQVKAKGSNTATKRKQNSKRKL